MFLVRRAGEVMERDVTMLPKDTRFETFLRQGAQIQRAARHRGARSPLAGGRELYGKPHLLALEIPELFQPQDLCSRGIP
jgi:hypothetical protein